MTSGDFDEILATIVDEEGASSLLQVPGVYAALSEHFNNEVLEHWAAAHPVEAWQGDHPEAVRKVRSMDRERVVCLLEGVSIECRDEEGIDVLREALLVNLADGTIDESELEEP